MRTQQILAPVVAIAVLVALYLVFLVAPTEVQMGDVQRIFYFHAASGIVMYVCFTAVAIASGIYLWNGSERADRVALSSAEVGVLFCTFVCVSGPIWARPIWGVWWTWDPRLTMTIILWGVYVAYLMLRAFGGEEAGVARYAAVLGIVGVLDIPAIRLSVRFLQGMHPSVMQSRAGGESGLDPTMKQVWSFTIVALTLLAWWLIAMRARLEKTSNDVAALRRAVDGSAA